MNRLAVLLVLASCGGGHRQATTPGVMTKTIGLESFVAHQVWYRAPAVCGQGPYDIVIPPTEAMKWRGEQVELLLHAKHGVALHAVLLVDGAEVASTDGTFDNAGDHARLDNTRCLADKRERVAATRAGSGGGGTGSTTGVRVGVQVPTASVTIAQLEVETEPVLDSTTLLTFEVKKPAQQIVLRLWSVEPNDLDGVRLGALKLAWRPNVPEAEYEAYLVRVEQERVAAIERAAIERTKEIEAMRLRAEQERARREAELRIQLEQQREANECRLEATRRARGEQVLAGSAAHVKLCLEIAAEDEAHRRARAAALVAAEEARKRAEAERARGEEEARRRAIELEISSQRDAEAAAELERRRQMQLAIDRENQRRREQFCATHPSDRGCWGAGGMKVHLELEAHKREREQFCVDHKSDVRCWTQDQWEKKRAVWNERIAVVTVLKKAPEGPPPAPLAEEPPPKLSAHATWRPGYWHWLDEQWIWLAGQWRVPEEDIVAEQTTTAPAAPPPLREEVPPPPPVASTVWVAGFWQWNGTSWVWIAGSYQLRPSVQVTWRAPEWRARGNVHVLIPGGWIRLGGSR